MAESSEVEQKNRLLRRLLPLLARRKIAVRWATAESPFTELEQECEAVVRDVDTSNTVSAYLSCNPLLPRSVDSLLAHYSSAAFARAEQVQGPARLLAQRGVYLGLWIPTFLAVDGPIGRFLSKQSSPMNLLLRTKHADYPLLCQARDLMDSDLFRLARNGLAHWSFVFEVRESRECLVCFDLKTGRETVALDVLEANAFHAASFATIECIDRIIFRAGGRDRSF